MPLRFKAGPKDSCRSQLFPPNVFHFIVRRAEARLGRDEDGYRAEFAEWVRKVSAISLQERPSSIVGLKRGGEG